ncbi:interferon-inducible GTPase 5-like [Cetorhinus maximus]
MNKAFESGGLPELVSKILNRLPSLGDITINIGVTGEAGAGKSSLVNALRGLSDDQPGAAASGVTETTMRPARYPHPTITNLQIWDLPGLGTPKFQLENYREKVGFNRYDFFIIVASGRFKENHATLAKWIKESGAGFYFVCTKIDRDIEATLKRRRTSFNQDEVLEAIRKDLLRYLGEHGVKSPQVFLVSACNFQDYDSKRLLEALEREFPKCRKRAFLRSIRTPSSQIIAGKKDFLSAEIWKLAFLSTVAAMVPIPEVGILCDVGILLRNLPFYYQCFGLDEGALNRISAEIEKPVDELKAQIHSPQPTDINKHLFYQLMSNSSGMGLIAGAYLAHGVPAFGSVLSGGIAFTMTKRMLTRFLQDLAADTERVLQWVIQSQIE